MIKAKTRWHGRRRGTAILSAAALLAAGSSAWADDELGPGAEAAASVAYYVLGGGYSAEANLSQGQVGNTLNQTDVTEVTDITGSLNGNVGITQVNQDAGNFVNQANIVSIAMGGSARGTLGELAASVSVEYVGNTVVADGARLENHIHNSFNGGSGVTQVNQNAGGFNNQYNVMVVGVGLDGTEDLIALSDSDLSAHVGENEVTLEGDIEMSNSLTDSFNNYSGIAQVSQAAGYGITTTQKMIVTTNTVTLP